MKKRFVVELTKTINYEVEAETIDEAEEIVADIESDKEAEIQWAIVPYTEITIKTKEG